MFQNYDLLLFSNNLYQISNKYFEVRFLLESNAYLGIGAY